jgi:hypothetical protein
MSEDYTIVRQHNFSFKEYNLAERQGSSVARKPAYGSKGLRFKSSQQLMFHYSAVYLNCWQMENYSIIHMFQMDVLLQNITSIQNSMFKVCLPINLSKHS